MLCGNEIILQNIPPFMLLFPPVPGNFLGVVRQDPSDLESNRFVM